MMCLTFFNGNMMNILDIFRDMTQEFDVSNCLTLFNIV